MKKRKELQTNKDEFKGIPHILKFANFAIIISFKFKIINIFVYDNYKLMTKTLVKICGITSKEQAFKIAEMGVDAIGIISVEESPRYIVNKNKVDIFKNLKSFFPKIKRVSVVKNCPADLIIENFRVEPIETTLQLHGDEDIDYCKKIRKEIPDVEIWKAFRINSKKTLKK